MIKRFIAFAMMAGLGVIFMALLAGYEPDAALNLTALYYAENTAREIGAANIVTAIVVTYGVLTPWAKSRCCFWLPPSSGWFCRWAAKPKRVIPSWCQWASC